MRRDDERLQDILDAITAIERYATKSDSRKNVNVNTKKMTCACS